MESLKEDIKTAMQSYNQGMEDDSYFTEQDWTEEPVPEDAPHPPKTHSALKNNHPVSTARPEYVKQVGLQ